VGTTSQQATMRICLVRLSGSPGFKSTDGGFLNINQIMLYKKSDFVTLCQNLTTYKNSPHNGAQCMDEARIQDEINKYRKFKKVDGATYRKVNQFLRKRTYITAREWALARLCTDFRTTGGAEMTFIGQHLPQLVPFMEDTYTPQAVNQARNSFKKKVRKASATFFYGAMCGFFTTDELDDLLFEASEVARFLLEVEGTTLDIDEEIEIEDRITKVMRSVGEAAKTILKTRNMELEQRAKDSAPSNDIPDSTLTAGTDLPVKIKRARNRKTMELKITRSLQEPIEKTGTGEVLPQSPPKETFIDQSPAEQGSEPEEITDLKKDPLKDQLSTTVVADAAAEGAGNVPGADQQ
jgi:hypothetical protein